jgi:hypothetical protein
LFEVAPGLRHASSQLVVVELQDLQGAHLAPLRGEDAC